MASNELTVVDHITINVANIEQSIAWYQSSFSCEVVFQSTTQAQLAFANVKVSLVLPSQQRPHLALLKPDAASFGSLRQQPEGIHSTMVSDPTGNIIELVSEIEPIGEAV